jgi:hypothetical protein
MPDAARPRPRLKRGHAIFLALLIAYEVIAFADQKGLRAPGWLKPFLWPAQWKMFTPLNQRQSEIVFEGLFDGQWRPLPMHEWYPARWESGYRWERKPFYERRSRQVPFAAAACRESGAEKVRIIRVRWLKTLGSFDQPPKKRNRKTLLTWDCSDEPPQATGRVL